MDIYNNFLTGLLLYSASLQSVIDITSIAILLKYNNFINSKVHVCFFLYNLTSLKSVESYNHWQLTTFISLLQYSSQNPSKVCHLLHS